MYAASIITHYMSCVLRAELLAQELKELQAELGDYNTVMSAVITAVYFWLIEYLKVSFLNC